VRLTRKEQRATMPTKKEIKRMEALIGRQLTPNKKLASLIKSMNKKIV